MTFVDPPSTRAARDRGGRPSVDEAAIEVDDVGSSRGGMGYIGANILAILLATASGLGVGVGLDRVTRGPAGRTRTRSLPILAVACLAEAWLAAILAGALILAPAAGPGPWVMALATAVVIWIGFVLPTTAVSLLHAGHSAATVLAHAAHWLTVMVVQAAVLQAVGLVRPT